MLRPPTDGVEVCGSGVDVRIRTVAKDGAPTSVARLDSDGVLLPDCRLAGVLEPAEGPRVLAESFPLGFNAVAGPTAPLFDAACGGTNFRDSLDDVLAAERTELAVDDRDVFPRSTDARPVASREIFIVEFFDDVSADRDVEVEPVTGFLFFSLSVTVSGFCTFRLIESENNLVIARLFPMPGKVPFPEIALSVAANFGGGRWFGNLSLTDGGRIFMSGGAFISCFWPGNSAAVTTVGGFSTAPGTGGNPAKGISEIDGILSIDSPFALLLATLEDCSGRRSELISISM